jgi:subtilisin family serine protease
MKKVLFAAAMAITVASGAAFADNGHGTHTAGTIGAVGNNGTAIGGQGRDVLIGGVGTDYLGIGVSLVFASVQYLVQVR